MATAQVPLDFARSLLNDSGGTLWTNTILLPFLQQAHRELQVKLQLAGIPVINYQTAALTVAIGATSLNASAGFPTNLIEPIQLKERRVGELLQDFQDMTECQFIPDVEQTDRLTYWAWIGETIQLLGATSANEVQLRYKGGLTVPSAANSALGFLYAENYLGYRTAALAGNSVANETGYQQWSMEADKCFDEVKRMNIKGQQNLPARRRGYHRLNGWTRPIRGL